ncbi:MAG TPA: hypothetical protein VGO50_11530 [Pyrinomonadaceae bacterium]|jgi:hypothetical protein|nr:hypothetical protein [Pyrinomonadaceae bacterium]
MISDFFIFVGKWLQGDEQLSIAKLFIAFGERLKEGSRKDNRKKNPKKRDYKAKIWGAFFSLFGLIAILIALYIEEYFKNLAIIPNELSILSLRFSEHVGVALIVLGLVSLIVDFDSWRKYFQERLAETIVKRDYLKTLRKEQLTNLQTDTLIALFEMEDINKEDSFLEYFRAKLQTFIASPYREDIKNKLIIRFEDIKTKKNLVVEDIISYKCKKMGKCIQERVRWENDQPSRIVDFQITLEIPDDVFNLPQTKRNHKKQKIVIPKGDKRLLPIGEKGYILPLTKYLDMDGLWVEVRGKYVVEKSELIYFTMAHPSHKTRLTVSYPEELQLSTGYFGVAEGDLKKRKIYQDLFQ